MKSRIHLLGAIILAACALTLTLSLLLTSAPQATPVSAQRLQRAQAVSCSFTNITVTATNLGVDPGISDTLPGTPLSRTLYFANRQAGVITISVALTNGTPISCHLWGEPALGRTETATFEVAGERQWLTYPVSVTHSSDTVVLTASEFITGLQYVTASHRVELTFTQDITGPKVNSQSITTTASHLHPVSATLYYTDTKSSGEFFFLNGDSVDEGTGLWNTQFSSADLGCGTSSPTSQPVQIWSAKYCLNGLPDPGVLTATSYDYVGNATAVTFTYKADGTPPTSTIISQPDGPLSTPVQLEWKAGDLKSGVEFVRLWYQKETTGTWTSSDITGTGASGTFAGFEFPAGDGLYRFASQATDNVGNVEAEPVVSETQVLYDAQIPRSQITEAVPQYSRTLSFTITWVATPTTSGLDEVRLWYRFNQGEWMSTTLTDTAESGNFIFDAAEHGGEGRYELATRVTNQAGKSEPMPEGSGDATVYYDHTITPPWGFQVQPADWTNVNTFTATWVVSPTEVSGIAGARYKLGETAPLSATDGITATGVITTVGGITVTADGEYPLWVWLYDRAGNVSHTTAVSDLLQYDGTHPTVAITAPEHISATIFVVEWGSDAGVSGLRSYDLQYRIGSGLWQDWLTETTKISETFTVTETDVRYTFHVTACDKAGNRVSAEAATYVGAFRIYLPLVIRNYPTIPEGRVIIDSGATYAHQTNVTLYLTASIVADEIVGFRVSNDKATLTDADWEEITPTTPFSATRPWDLVEDVSELKKVYVQFKGREGGISSVVSDGIYLARNGNFENDLDYWGHAKGPFNGHGSGLSQAVVSNQTVLGEPNAENESIPVGYGYIAQEFKIPTEGAHLSFDYHVFSYDHVRGAKTGRYFDTFELSINRPPNQITDQERDSRGCQGSGLNPTGAVIPPENGGLVFCGGQPSTDPPNWWDFGGTVTLDLSDFAGENITLYMAIWSREYEAPYYNDKAYYNTYAYVDNITVEGDW